MLGELWCRANGGVNMAAAALKQCRRTDAVDKLRVSWHVAAAHSYKHRNTCVAENIAGNKLYMLKAYVINLRPIGIYSFDIISINNARIYARKAGFPI